MHVTIKFHIIAFDRWLIANKWFCFVQYVPTKFYRKYLSREVKWIKIQDCDGAEWPVSIKWPNHGCLIKGGWYKFLQEKDLEEGDICVFELIRNNDIVLKVSVHKI